MTYKKKLARYCVFAMFGAIMYVSYLLTQWLPNIHMLGMFVMLLTVVYRFQALVPIYVYVFLTGVTYGFAIWWVPYLYLWAILWGVTMLIPKGLGKKWAMIVYPVVCGAFGLSFGALYAPAQAFFFGYDLKTTLLWIGAGFYFDLIHAAGNVAFGLLIYPLSVQIRKLNKSFG